MTGIEITDYDILMKKQIRGLFTIIYPDQPAIADLMCYDPGAANHIATKVAYSSDAMVGQANIFLHKALAGNANLGFHVHPAMRGQGIATTLSSEVIKKAHSKGITVLYIRTHEDNLAAISVARKSGFIKDDNKFVEKGLVVFRKQF